MPEFTVLDEKPAEVLGLAQAARPATTKVVRDARLAVAADEDPAEAA